MSLKHRLAGLLGRRVHGLRLRRPLAVFDLETTGASPFTDQIVEITILRLSPDGSEDTLRLRVKPLIPIETGATAVHGITDEDVAKAPTFAELAGAIRAYLEGCDLAGYNVIRFDLPLLEAEFRRVGVEFSRKDRAVIDAMRIYHLKEPRDLTAAARYYLGRTMPDVHASETDVRATLDVLSAQIERYEDVPDDMDALHELCNPVNPDWIDPEGKFAWKGGVATIAFGKHEGRSLQELAAEPEPNYLYWMLSEDFPPEVMEIARDALRGKFPTPPV